MRSMIAAREIQSGDSQMTMGSQERIDFSKIVRDAVALGLQYVTLIYAGSEVDLNNESYTEYVEIIGINTDITVQTISWNMDQSTQ